MKKYRAVVRQDESGHWIAHVPTVPGCHTFARSLWGLQPRVREALSLWVDDADEAHIELDVALPEKVHRAVDRAKKAQERAARSAVEWKEVVTRTVRELEKAGFSRRDSADLLGLSHQRIQQLAREAK